MQIIILNQSGNHTNQYPACNYWNHWSWLSQMEMSRITGVSQGDIWKAIRRVQDTKSLSHGWAGDEDDYMKKDRVIRIMKDRFLAACRVRVVLSWRIRRRIFVCKVQRRLVVAGYPQDIPTDVQLWRLIITTYDAYWYTVTRTGTIGIGLMRYLLMSPMSASTILISCFLDATSH